VFDFVFVPFGNAFFASAACPATSYDHSVRMCWNARCNGTAPPSDCFGGAGGTMVCQHGDAECAANRVEGCAVKLAGSSAAAFPFIRCFEVEHGCKAGAAQTCAAQNGPFSFGDLEACYSGPDGLAVDAANAKLTAAIPGGHAVTPWPLLDGAAPASKDLLAEVCAKIAGPKPAGCAGVAPL